MEALILAISFSMFSIALVGCRKIILQKNTLSIEAGWILSVLPLLCIIPIFTTLPDLTVQLQYVLSLGYLLVCISLANIGIAVSIRLFKKKWWFKILAGLNLILVAVYVTVALTTTYLVSF